MKMQLTFAEFAPSMYENILYGFFLTIKLLSNRLKLGLTKFVQCFR